MHRPLAVINEMCHMQTPTLAIQRIMPIIAQTIGKSVNNFRFAFLHKITPSIFRIFSHASKEMPANDKTRAQSSQKQPKLYSNSMGGSKSSSNSKSNQRQQRQNSPSVPSNAYVALFPYKPQKSDELELKKGCKC